MKTNYIISEILNKVSLIGTLEEIEECIIELKDAKQVLEQQIEALEIEVLDRIKK